LSDDSSTGIEICVDITIHGTLKVSVVERVRRRHKQGSPFCTSVYRREDESDEESMDRSDFHTLEENSLLFRTNRP